MNKLLCAVMAILSFAACQNTPKLPDALGGQKEFAGNFPTPDWVRSAVLYECNVRQFSPGGDFHGLRAQLPRLRDLGIDVLWIMPIHPIGEQNRKLKAYHSGKTEDLDETISHISSNFNYDKINVSFFVVFNFFLLYHLSHCAGRYPDRI